MSSIAESDEGQRGWVKPTRRRTLAELKVLIDEKRAELDVLVQEANELTNDGRLQAIATARNIMRAHQLTLDDVLEKPPVRASKKERAAESNELGPQDQLDLE